MLQRTPRTRLRSLFLSDIHLGTRACQADLLLDFLARHEAEIIYLVGDVIDGWKLRRGWHWPQAHSDVLQALLAAAGNGTRVVYVPGNHDDFARPYAGHRFGAVEVANRTIHETADGRRLLVMHGDEFDVVLRWAPWLSLLGSGLYNAAFAVNGLVNRVRRLLRLRPWSFSDWAKQSVKGAVNCIGAYERALVAEAVRERADGVVCGHIHHAALHDRWGIRYVNTGDWMESCTAVVEHFDGRMEIVRWREASASGAAGLSQSRVFREASAS